MAEIEAYKDSLTLGNKLKRLIWNVCCLLLFRPFGLPIFKSWRNFVLILFGTKMGKGCIVHASAKIWYPKNLTMGDYVCIGPYTDIYNADKIIIGNKVTISQRTFICTASHDISSLNRPLITKTIKIESYVWICADAFVGPGIKIGEGAIVGARACVFKNVEPWTVVGGNPAKFIKKRELK